MAGFEGGFPFIPFAYVNIVIAPSYVEFAEQLHSLEVFNTLGKVRKGGDIFLSDCIEWVVVDDVAFFLAVFLGDHKGAESIG